MERAVLGSLRALRPLCVLLLVLPLLLAAPHHEEPHSGHAVQPPAATEVDTTTARGQGGFLDFSRGYQRIGKKMILPLLVGILLKVASFVPLILAKLSLLALASIIASKLALLISAIVGTKKLASVPYSYSHHGGGDWEGSASNMYANVAHPGAAAAAAYGAAAAYNPVGMNRRRVAPVTGAGMVSGALSSLAAHLGRGLQQGRSLSTVDTAGTQQMSEPAASLTTLPTPVSTTTAAPSTPPERSTRQRRAVGA